MPALVKQRRLAYLHVTIVPYDRLIQGVVGFSNIVDLVFITIVLLLVIIIVVVMISNSSVASRL